MDGSDYGGGCLCWLKAYALDMVSCYKIFHSKHELCRQGPELDDPTPTLTGQFLLEKGRLLGMCGLAIGK